MKYNVYIYIFTSENIRLYIFTPPECTYNFLWISIDLLQCTSELQTHITFLFVNENIKCGYAFSRLEHEKYFGTKIIWLC